MEVQRRKRDMFDGLKDESFLKYVLARKMNYTARK
jgi:hypothetical protein